MSRPELPYWVYDLINAVEAFEDTHPYTSDPDACLYRALFNVPLPEKETARAINMYNRQTKEPVNA